MDEKGSKQVDVLDVQPAAAAREQIAAAVFEWQLRLHKTMLARFLPPIKISVEVPLCIVEHQTSAARVVVVFRITEERRSNKVLDTLKKEDRRTSTAHRGQHQAQRGVAVFIVVDIENFLRSSKTFHQSRELTPVAQTVDFESH